MSPVTASEVKLESYKSEVKVAKIKAIPEGPNPIVKDNSRVIFYDLTQISKSIEKRQGLLQIQYGPFS